MRILSVGEDPATVDYSKTPDGVDEAYIRKGIDQALEQMKERGWDAEMCIVPPEVDKALEIFKRMLGSGNVDIVLMGGGLRMPPERVALFEAHMNEAHRSAPNARFAFDNDPYEAPDAVSRLLKNGG